MGLRLLTCILALYIAADLANPLMPGAVTFVDGSVEAVDVERARVLDRVPDVPAAVSLAGAEVAAPACHARRPALIRPAVRPLIPFRRAFRAPDRPPTSEDH
jgi:hypothetical protein